MARIQLELPEKWLFETSLQVRISDVNYGGHLGNDAVLGLVHETRVRFLRSLGCSEIDVGGAGIIMADAAIVYKAEAFAGDELRIRIGIDDVKRSAVDMLYQLERLSDEQEIARAKTGLVFFDYQARKIVRMPQRFAQALGL